MNTTNQSKSILNYCFMLPGNENFPKAKCNCLNLSDPILTIHRYLSYNAIQPPFTMRLYGKHNPDPPKLKLILIFILTFLSKFQVHTSKTIKKFIWSLKKLEPKTCEVALNSQDLLLSERTFGKPFLSRWMKPFWHIYRKEDGYFRPFYQSNLLARFHLLCQPTPSIFAVASLALQWNK